MAGRSTRNKLRWQALQILNNISTIFKHLQYIDEFAAGNSPYINHIMPILVQFMQETEKLFTRFREGL